MDYQQHFSTRITPQNQAIPGKAQVANSAGGYSFAVNDWTALRRFLILGSEKGSYYISEKALTVKNAEAVQRCIAANGHQVIAEVVAISDRGRAAKNEPALFVLAMCTAASDVAVRKAAWAALPKVARIGTHLFQFAAYREAFGGWGRMARQGLANWYREKTPENLAFQVLKYQQRNGWSHRDLLRIAHVTGDVAFNAIVSAVVAPEGGVSVNARNKHSPNSRPARLSIKEMIKQDMLPRVFEGVEKVRAAETPKEVAYLINEYKLAREMVPTEHLNSAEVWEALFEHMPMGAMVRNLGNMSKVGLLKPLSETAKKAAARLQDPKMIKSARLHPLALLTALKTYSSGKGMRGKGEWTVVPQVVDALDKALQLSFDAVEPTGLRYVYGVDVSGSMGYNTCMDLVTCAEAAGVLALVAAKTESQYFIGGFADVFRDLKITASDNFTTACRKVQRSNFGSTDCAVPVLHALKEGIQADVFQIFTDNETWVGHIHPSQALQQYRQHTGIPAKMVVVGMCANEFSIADPNDAGMLDVVGMDTSVPAVVAEFAKSSF